MSDITFHFAPLTFANLFFESATKLVLFYQGILTLYCFEASKL